MLDGLEHGYEDLALAEEFEVAGVEELLDLVELARESLRLGFVDDPAERVEVPLLFLVLFLDDRFL